MSCNGVLIEGGGGWGTPGMPGERQEYDGIKGKGGILLSDKRCVVGPGRDFMTSRQRMMRMTVYAGHAGNYRTLDNHPKQFSHDHLHNFRPISSPPRMTAVA